MSNTIFADNQVALSGGRGQVENSLVVMNEKAVESLAEGFVLVHNSIYSNTQGVTLGQYDGFSPPVHNNNLYGNTQFNLKNPSPFNVDATNNWWGTTDPGLIEAGLYDGYDDTTLGLLAYRPFLLQPATTTQSATPILPLIALSQKQINVSEALNHAVITVTVSGNYSTPLAVNYVISGTTATPGKDYNGESSVLIFTPGQSSRLIKLPIINDKLDEPDEGVTLRLNTPFHATLAPDSNLTLLIVDDDLPETPTSTPTSTPITTLTRTPVPTNTPTILPPLTPTPPPVTPAISKTFLPVVTNQ